VLSGLLSAERLQGGSMNDRDRLEQLRALLVRLERMPVSAERDWMIGEVRARAVDVETGEKPAAMRARSGDGAEPALPAAPTSARSRPTETVPPPKPHRAPRRPVTRGAWDAPPAAPASSSSLTPAPPRAAHETVADPLEQDGVLCLEDEPAVADAATRPWSAGLRG
jgi:hypothetical protein